MFELATGLLMCAFGAMVLGARLQLVAVPFLLSLLVSVQLMYPQRVELLYATPSGQLLLSVTIASLLLGSWIPKRPSTRHL
jgi:Flp pilus assembly protein TadB